MNLHVLFFEQVVYSLNIGCEMIFAIVFMQDASVFMCGFSASCFIECLLHGKEKF
jgi:hypothetical protein